MYHTVLVHFNSLQTVITVIKVRDTNNGSNELTLGQKII